MLLKIAHISTRENTDVVTQARCKKISVWAQLYLKCAQPGQTQRGVGNGMAVWVQVSPEF